MRYFHIHVEEAGSGFSLGVAIDNFKTTLTDGLTMDEKTTILSAAVEQNKLDAEDRPFVDEVNEIDLDEYQLLTYI